MGELAKRHLAAGGLVLYDLTSSYFEGITCPLATLGYNRDGKKGKLQVNYGLLTDELGCPVALQVFPGNTLDHHTLMSQTEKLRDRFGIQMMVLVGDRGMITQKLIDEKLQKISGVDWITALKSGSIKKLVKDDQVQLGLFAEINLFEVTTPEYPGERLVVCRNPELAKLRTWKRQALLNATAEKLEDVRSIVEGGKLRGKDKIARRLDNVAKKHKVVKQFAFTVRDDGFDVHLDDRQKAAEAALDGIYVIRTSLPTDRISAEDTVRSYKSFSQIERAFRSMKTVDLKVRSIRHHLEKRVQAHIFLCMLAYYVEWNMREAWRPIVFADEDCDAKKTSDPVAPAKRSEAALQKVRSKRLNDGTEVHSFQTLLKLMSQIVRNECRLPGAGHDEPTFDIVTTPDEKQKRAYDLLKNISL